MQPKSWRKRIIWQLLLQLKHSSSVRSKRRLKDLICLIYSALFWSLFYRTVPCARSTIFFLSTEIGTINPRASTLLADRNRLQLVIFLFGLVIFIIYTVDNISKCIWMETNVRKMPTKCLVYAMFDVSKCCNELRRTNLRGFTGKKEQQHHVIQTYQKKRF